MTTTWKAKPKQQKPLRQRVEAKFLRFMESFAVTDYAEVRAIIRELLANADRCARTMPTQYGTLENVHPHDANPTPK
jgi:hypothetical protein